MTDGIFHCNADRIWKKETQTMFTRDHATFYSSTNCLATKEEENHLMYKRISTRRVQGLAFTALLSIGGIVPTTAQAQIANGSFETDKYAGWTLFEGAPPAGSFGAAAGTWGIASDGQTIVFGESVFDLFNGIFVNVITPGLPITYAATDRTKVAIQLQRFAQTHRMFQTVTLDPATTTLFWDMQYTNHHGSFVPNEQDIQITIRNPATDAVLATVFATTQGVDPQSVAVMTPFSADISAFAASTVRISVDLNVRADTTDFNLDFDSIDAAFDNFRIDNFPGDDDADGVFDDVDNCPITANTGQEDIDSDGVGDACDNCGTLHNPGQEDLSGNGIGDLCDTFAEGDLYLLSHNFPVGSQNPPSLAVKAIVRIDPVTGFKAVLHVFAPAEINAHFTYDPCRNRLVTKEWFAQSFLLLDIQGNTTELPYDWPPGVTRKVIRWAPTGDGRLYMYTNGEGFVGYVDACGQAHDLFAGAIWNAFYAASDSP